MVGRQGTHEHGTTKRWAVLASALTLLVLIGWVGTYGTSWAADECGSEPTLSSDGETVRGTACDDQIVVTSPTVDSVYGGEGDDVIAVNGNVENVTGGPGDDVIYGELPATETGSSQIDSPDPDLNVSAAPQKVSSRSGATASTTISCTAGVPCYGGNGSQTLTGSSGNDIIFGQRGDDSLYGNQGNDNLYGGIGDEDVISGGADNDVLSGGMGADKDMNGGDGSDLTRGDPTGDTMYDNGSTGSDTLSFSTSTAPGFGGAVSTPGFPGTADGDERGVYVDLSGGNCSSSYQACNSSNGYGARYGGGTDTVTVSGYERVIGSPFADVIQGNGLNNRIDGGGGADIIYGNGGNDDLYGGADGDYLDGGLGSNNVYGEAGDDYCTSYSALDSCSPSITPGVVSRDRSKISVGFEVNALPTELRTAQLYMTGAATGPYVDDNVQIHYTVDSNGTGLVSFIDISGHTNFDTSGNGLSPNCSNSNVWVVCALPVPLDSIELSGMAGNDQIEMNGTNVFPNTTTPIISGGEGDDTLTGGPTEDILVDGTGSGGDHLYSKSYDDAVINNAGTDHLEAGNGNDLVISAETCDGDFLTGSEPGGVEATDNASWAQLDSGRVVANLGTNTAGNSSGPSCSGGGLDSINHFKDLEGSNQGDGLYGDSGNNQLLGHQGADAFYGYAGNDVVIADAPDPDTDNYISCGGQPNDLARIDPEDPNPVGC